MFVDGRRNTYLLYTSAFSLAGAPLLALAASLAHATVTAAVYFVRSVQHLSRLDVREGARKMLELLRG